MNLGYPVLRAPVRTEPIRAGLEVRLEDGFEHQLQPRLHHAVGDRGNPELPELPLGPLVPLGIITCHTATRRNASDFSASRIWPRKASVPTQVSTRPALILSMPEVRAPVLVVTRSHAHTRNAGS